MFTGIVETTGTVRELTRTGDNVRLAVEAPGMLDGARPGDSIAVDGCCLTIVDLAPPRFTAFLSTETLRLTAFGGARPGDRVNLERALAVGDRLGGHMVQGHVDGVGRVVALAPDGDGWSLTVRIPRTLLRQVVLKGSIAIAGISLTVASLADDVVGAAIIPATVERTTMSAWRAGTRVHIETDIIGKYVERYLAAATSNPSASGDGHDGAPDGRVTADLLRRAGFTA